MVQQNPPIFLNSSIKIIQSAAIHCQRHDKAAGSATTPTGVERRQKVVSNTCSTNYSHSPKSTITLFRSPVMLIISFLASPIGLQWSQKEKRNTISQITPSRPHWCQLMLSNWTNKPRIRYMDLIHWQEIRGKKTYNVSTTIFFIVMTIPASILWFYSKKACPFLHWHEWRKHRGNWLGKKACPISSCETQYREYRVKDISDASNASH